MTERSAAECKACPQGNRIRGIRGNCWNPGEKQSGKRNKAAAAGDGIHRTGEYSRKKQQNCVREIEVWQQVVKDVELCFRASRNSRRD